MADLITLQQFEDRTGRALAGTPQGTQAQELIGDASALVIDIVDDPETTDTWDAAVADSVPRPVVPVVVAMVRRGLDNPHGYTQQSIGSYSHSGASGRGVFTTRQEARIIRKAAGTSGVGALNLDSYLPESSAAWADGAL